MARSDPPFDAADDTTTRPMRRSEPVPVDASEPPAAEGDEAAATAPPPAEEPSIVLRQNTNWFELDLDAEDVATMAVTQPVEQLPQETVAPHETPDIEPPPAHSKTGAPGEGLEALFPEPQPESAAPVERQAEPSFGLPTEPVAEPPVGLPQALTFEHSPEPARHAPTVAFDGASAHAAPALVQAPTTVAPFYAPAPAHPQRAGIGDLIVRAGRVTAIVLCAWFCVVLALIALFRFVNPPFSSLMAAQWLGGTGIRHDWVPLENISPNLIHAVVVSEDSRFCEHWGIDFVEIAEALKRTPHGPPRGASTITMQVAKNLFLWPAKSYVRKVIEVPLTFAIELFWPKRRILEVYLNIAEWGPGIFGAEAASQAHFNRPASQLSARQAAQLAVALPNPIIRDAGDPGPRTAHQASVIQRRTGREPEAIGCVLGGE